MDVREKLIELLKTNACPAPFMCDPACRYYGFGDCFPDRFADHLINNGVTVKEYGQWIYDFNLAGSNFYRCSVCDRQETLLEKEDIYEYCPFCHCGAKMMPQPPKGE